MTDPEADVPYGEDFHDPKVAAAWADAVMRKRPWRAEVLICDHLPAGAHTPRHTVLYMSPQEKLEALTGAGLVDAQVVWCEHDMALYRARASGQPEPRL